MRNERTLCRSVNLSKQSMHKKKFKNALFRVTNNVFTAKNDVLPLFKNQFILLTTKTIALHSNILTSERVHIHLYKQKQKKDYNI